VNPLQDYWDPESKAQLLSGPLEGGGPGRV